jgi:ABC transporter DrrB family efflux protein
MTAPTNIGQSVADINVLVRRNMLRYRRLPDVAAILLLQPLILLLLFRYVLGGESRLPDYIEYLMPGIVALAVIDGSATIGIGVAEDLASGAIDRLRALPIARSTFLMARAITDIAKNLVIIPLVGAVGVAVGFNFVGSAADIALAFLLLLALGWMFAWISMAIALWTGSVEATQGAAITIALVFSFTSSGFAQVSTMPSWLQRLANLNPVTHVDDTVRALTATANGPTAHSVLISLAWIAAFLVVMIPLAVARYAQRAR